MSQLICAAGEYQQAAGLPELAAAEGRQVEQLDPAVLPTEDPGPAREEGSQRASEG